METAQTLININQNNDVTGKLQRARSMTLNRKARRRTIVAKKLGIAATILVEFLVFFVIYHQLFLNDLGELTVPGFLEASAFSAIGVIALTGFKLGSKRLGNYFHLLLCVLAVILIPVFLLAIGAMQISLLKPQFELAVSLAEEIAEKSAAEDVENFEDAGKETRSPPPHCDEPSRVRND